MAVTPITDEALPDIVWKQYERLGSWSAVGKHFGVHRAVVWRIVNQDYIPKNNSVRKRLGLAEIVQQEVQRDKKGRFVRRGP